jgi:hypothetical protein
LEVFSATAGEAAKSTNDRSRGASSGDTRFN